MHFQTTRINSLKKFFLSPGVVKNVFLCFCAYFQTTRIMFLKKIFFNVWRGKKCVLMHFQTTRIKSLKFYFFTSGVVKNVFLCISRPPESSPQNFIFSRLEWLKTCFYAYAHTSRPSESSP
jgi:hypothetical protein